MIPLQPQENRDLRTSKDLNSMNPKDCFETISEFGEEEEQEAEAESQEKYQPPSITEKLRYSSIEFAKGWREGDIKKVVQIVTIVTSETASNAVSNITDTTRVGWTKYFSSAFQNPFFRRSTFSKGSASRQPHPVEGKKDLVKISRLQNARPTSAPDREPPRRTKDVDEDEYAPHYIRQHPTFRKRKDEYLKMC